MAKHRVKLNVGEASIAQCIRLHLPFFHPVVPGSNSLFNLVSNCILKFSSYCEGDKNEQKEACVGPFKKDKFNEWMKHFSLSLMQIATARNWLHTYDGKAQREVEWMKYVLKCLSWLQKRRSFWNAFKKVRTINGLFLFNLPTVFVTN